MIADGKHAAALLHEIGDGVEFCRVDGWFCAFHHDRIVVQAPVADHPDDVEIEQVCARGKVEIWKSAFGSASRLALVT